MLNVFILNLKILVSLHEICIPCLLHILKLQCKIMFYISAVFVTGSRDGSLILWDARCSRKCSKLPVSHLPDQIIYFAANTSKFDFKKKGNPLEHPPNSCSVTGLVFQNDNTLISSGSAEQ